MKKMLLTAMALAVSVSAQAAPPCLLVGQIYNWDVQNDQTLIVEDNLHHKFKVSLMGHCSPLKFPRFLTIGFKSFDGFPLSCLTRGDAVIHGDSVGPLQCPILKVEFYTPEMQKADLEAAKANKPAAP